MLSDLADFIKGLPIKDWGGTILGGFFALLGIVYTQRSKKVMMHEQHLLNEAKARVEAADRAKAGDRTFDIAQTQDLTARFKALMDGYEARIIDTTHELRDTKQELREARAEIAKLREQLDAG